MQREALAAASARTAGDAMAALEKETEGKRLADASDVVTGAIEANEARAEPRAAASLRKVFREDRRARARTRAQRPANVKVRSFVAASAEDAAAAAAAMAGRRRKVRIKAAAGRRPAQLPAPGKVRKGMLAGVLRGIKIRPPRMPR
jgi:hypothetical protein